MADFQPFRGVLYNQEHIANLVDVVAPPYDVISTEEQEAYHRHHPNNVIRLILGRRHPDDNDRNNVYTRSADYLNRWMKEGILVRDSQPAFYLTSVTFEIDNRSITRFGIIGAVRVAHFEEGIVLPHERTFSKVKTEQLQLIKACQANFNPIFSLYSDSKGLLKRLYKRIEGVAPDWELTDRQGLTHRMWPLNDTETIQDISQSMADRHVYIADGHHRYETALNYNEWRKANDPNYSASDPSNFVMMKLISMEDPGLIILPAHRLLKDVDLMQAEGMLDRAAEYFEIHTFDMAENPEKALQAAASLQASRSADHAIGLCVQGLKRVFVMVVKPDVMERLFGDEMPASLLDLDVTVLTRLLMMELLGYDQQRLDDETKIGYCTTAKEAVRTVMDGKAVVGFLLNPTSIEQVQKVSEEGLTMPRKSTYFYPKLISGQVMNVLK